MAFDYFDRLSRRQQRTYQRSDAVGELAVPEAEGLADVLERLRGGLAADDAAVVRKACLAIVRGLCERLHVPAPEVKVLSRRPSDEGSELHGLYEREADGTAVLRVWMRTAAMEKPAAFKTFLRTLVHEVLHHLDFELLHLEDTFHTQGFFRRESSVVRQLLATLGEVPERPTRDRKAPAGDDDAQLDLFGKR